MICIFIQIWFFSAVVFANPIPQSSYDVTDTNASSLDADPSKNLEDLVSTRGEQIIENSHFNPSIKCSSMDENLNGKDLKKLSGACPAIYPPTTTPLGVPRLAKDDETLSQDELIKTRRFCTLTHKNHLSCGGPKVEMEGMMVVLNCLTGRFVKYHLRLAFL